MFEGLAGRLGGIFDRLRRRGALTETDVNDALREVRIALLEADVALPVAKDFIETVRPRAIGQDVIASVTPAQQVVKIVHDALVEMLGSTATPLSFAGEPPTVILMCGLQGSGKTTTTAKLGKRLQAQEKKRVLMASLDTQRPAAQDQLRLLGEQAGVPTVPIVAGEAPLVIAKRALSKAKQEGFDVLILDTAGRLSIDDALMDELRAIKAAAQPTESLLVVDILTGQDAAATATQFRDRIGLSGLVLTRIDGDARGGAALSLRAITGQPIKFLGLGEKLDALETYHPDRIAGRLLGMGDVVSLVEKAIQTIDQGAAEKMASKVMGGSFDLEDMAEQFRQMRRMGGVSGLLNFLPGLGGLKQMASEANVDEGILKRQEAIIQSMTPRERRDPDVLNASRKRRIAKGAGVEVSEINRLLKQHQQMRDMVRQLRKSGKKGLMEQATKLLGGGLGGMGGGMGGMGGR